MNEIFLSDIQKAYFAHSAMRGANDTMHVVADTMRGAADVMHGGCSG